MMLHRVTTNENAATQKLLMCTIAGICVWFPGDVPLCFSAEVELCMTSVQKGWLGES